MDTQSHKNDTVSRRMMAAKLLGSHLHRTTNGITVSIAVRDAKYLARGRWERRQFGETLGDDPLKAAAALRKLLVQLEEGSYVRPSGKRDRLLPSNSIPQLSFRQLCDEFLFEKRRLRGEQTAKNYRSRLAPVLDFAEQSPNFKKWRLAREINREFSVSLRTWLTQRTTTRNGHPGGTPRQMTPRHIQLCLETFRMVLAWGARAEVRKLPPDYVLPIDNELIGFAKSKDPLRQVLVPLEKRIELIGLMDCWQLVTLAPLLVLPLRFEDPAGILLSDVNFVAKTLKLGTRLGGADFNKGRVDVTMPLPDELVQLFRICAAGRSEGALFLSRTAIQHPRRFQIECGSTAELEAELRSHLATATTKAYCEQDKKKQYREMLHKKMGAVAANTISKELKKHFLHVGLGHCPPYSIRGAVTTEMKASGMPLLELRYLTEHSVNDILNEYATLDPFTAMSGYFARIKSLLSAIDDRAQQLGIIDSQLVAEQGTNMMMKPHVSSVSTAG